MQVSDTIGQARDDAQRIVALWQKPLLSDAEIAEVLGLPYSTWQQVKKSGDAPPLFKITRRVYALTTDVHAWIESKARCVHRADPL